MRIRLFIVLIACLTGHSAWAQLGVPQCVLQVNGAALIGGCVSTDRCNVETHTIYDDGTGIINTRLGLDDPIDCPSGQVCCSIAGNSNRSPRTTRPTTDSGSTERCGIQKRQTFPGFAKTKPNEADLGEFPWAVNIFEATNKSKNYRYLATGSLIHDRVVLTAAHLLNGKEASPLRVIIGAHYWNKKVLQTKTVEVDEIVTHNQFNSRNGDHNIALVFLKTSGLGLAHVGTVCLPPASYVPPTSTNCAFAGWGADSNRTAQSVLTKTEVPMMSHSACEERLRQNPQLGPGFYLLQSLFCAGGEIGKNLCGGAGGSALVCPIESEPGRSVQTGLVSWATQDCGVNGFPIVFADVASHRPWIDQQMASHQYSTGSYTY